MIKMFYISYIIYTQYYNNMHYNVTYMVTYIFFTFQYWDNKSKQMRKLKESSE